MMKLVSVFQWIVLVLFVISLLLFGANECIRFNNDYYIAPNISKVQKRYCYNDDNITESLYNFKNISADTHGNVYLQCDNKIIVYDENGRIKGEFCFDFSDFMFNVDSDCKLNIISKNPKLTHFVEYGYGTEDYYPEDNRVTTSVIDSSIDTYLLSYDVSSIDGALELGYNYQNRSEFKTQYDDYAKVNGFENSDIVSVGEKTYKYVGYGRLQVSSNNDIKTVELNCNMLPLPRLMFMCIASFFAVVTVIIFILKSKCNAE